MAAVTEQSFDLEVVCEGRLTVRLLQGQVGAAEWGGGWTGL